MIEAALKRLDHGTYGTCVSCGEEISPNAWRPFRTRPLCKDCAGAGKHCTSKTRNPTSGL
jgi:RNA polymerase-binding transcription factor DksA